MRWPGLVVAVIGLIGAGLLVVAEFTPLLQIHTTTSPTPVASVGTGAHDSYALVPIALLAAGLQVAIWRTGNRLCLLATGILGATALLIALLGDLPDAQSSGSLGASGVPAMLANATPSTGMYLETLGAVALLITAVGGLLLSEPLRRQAAPRAAGHAPPAGDQM